MRYKHPLSLNTQKSGKLEIHSLGSGIWPEN